ncbi:MAG: hypothetical protein IJT73_07355 [Selenomonadaceae bacterium]|nr:hypothetical protein [Selenomonadaceae bacterium]
MSDTKLITRSEETNKKINSINQKILVALVKARTNGIDEYSLAQEIWEVGNTVHHIYTIDERPDLKQQTLLLFLTVSKARKVKKLFARFAAVVQAKNIPE